MLRRRTEQSARGQVEDQTLLLARLQQFRLRRAVAETMAASYGAAAEAGRQIATATSGAMTDGGEVALLPRAAPLPNVDPLPLASVPIGGGTREPDAMEHSWE